MAAFRPSVLGNTSTSILRFLVGVVATFALTPYIIDHVGKSDFGLWSLVFSILGFIGLVDLGFATSTVKYVAETRGQGDVDRRNRLVSTLFVVYVGLALVVALASAVLSVWFNDLFAIPAEQRRDALFVFAILAVRLALYLPLGLFRGVLFGEQRIVSINVVQVAAALLNVVLTVFVLEAGFGIVALAVVNVVVLVAEHAAYVWITRRRVPDLRLRPRYFAPTLLRELLGFSVFAALVNVSSVVVLQADPIIIKLFLPLSAVAIYAVAMRIATYVLLLVKQLNNAVSPLIAERNGAGDRDGLRVIFVRASKFTLALALPLAVGLGVHADALMLHWLGPGFVEAGPVLVVLLAAMTVLLARETSSNYLALTGQHRYTATMAIVSAVANILVSSLLAWVVGLFGVAVGTLVTAIAVDLFFVVPRACRSLEIPIPTYLRRTALPVAGPTLALTVVLVALQLAWPPGSLLAILAQLAVAGLAFVGVFWLVALDPEERSVAAAVLARRRRSDAKA